MGGVALLSRVVRVGLTECLSRLEGAEELSHAGICRKGIPGASCAYAGLCTGRH